MCLFLGCNLQKKPKIAIAGLAIESSTFSPAKTVEEDFKARVGNDVFDYYPFLSPDSLNRQRAIWVPTLRGHALPGGIVTKEAYESLVGKTLNMLKKDMPYDGLFFDIHGAMSVEGIDDPEGDFIKRIRDLIGYETIISTSMDLHGNVSYELAKETDLITCYRLAPHEDALESKKEPLIIYYTDLKLRKVNLNTKLELKYQFSYLVKKQALELNQEKVCMLKLIRLPRVLVY